MSERITWERCPACGEAAAVGWTGDPGDRTDRSTPEEPAEFDCLSGCALSALELQRAFA